MFGMSKLSNFLSSLATQLLAAIQVGLPTSRTVEGSHLADEIGPVADLSEALRSDDVAGRMTRNGLGSLEIGAGKTRIED